jgi:hypothetical protein
MLSEPPSGFAGIRTAGQIDTFWALPIWQHFMEWLKTDARAEPFPIWNGATSSTMHQLDVGYVFAIFRARNRSSMVIIGIIRAWKHVHGIIIICPFSETSQR